VTVPDNVTLTIEAGTTVKFVALNDDQKAGSNTSRIELIIKGSLVAQGTSSAPITFTSTSMTPAKGDCTG